MSARLQSCLLFVAAAAICGAQETAPSDAARGLASEPSLSRLEGRIHGMVEGDFASGESRPAAGIASFHARHSMLGPVLRNQTFELRADASDPPAWIERDPAPGGRCTHLVVYDREHRILFVSKRPDQNMIARAIATSRCKSRRFSAEELDFLFRIACRGYSGPDLGLEPGPRPSPGLMEITGRFGSMTRDPELLAILGDPRALTRQEAESLQATVWDVDPAIKAAAAHLILDAGGTLDRESLRESLVGLHPGSVSPVFGPLLRIKDPLAIERLGHLLATQRGNEILPELQAVAAYGPPEFIPLVRPFLPTALVTWLRLGGGALGAEVIDVLEAQSAMRARKSLQAAPEFYRVAIARAARDPVTARRFIEHVGPPSIEAATQSPEVLFWAAVCGHEPSITELAKIEWTEHAIRAAVSEAGEAFAVLADPRVVDVLAAVFVAAWSGIPGDDTGLGGRAIVAIGTMLGRRGEADRARAIEIVDRDAKKSIRYGEDGLVRFRWALGVPPSPEWLLGLNRAWFSQCRELPLEPWRARYDAILPALRAEPRKHWFVLALLRDDTIIDEMGRWLDERFADPQHPKHPRNPLTALEMLGGERALEAVYRTANRLGAGTNPGALGYLALSIMVLETPDHWRRVAALSTPDRDPYGIFLFAAVRVLAKRP